MSFQRKTVAKGATGPPAVHLPAELYSAFETHKVVSFETFAHAQAPKHYKRGMQGLGLVVRDKLDPPAPFEPTAPLDLSVPLVHKVWSIRVFFIFSFQDAST
jgi:hypothetical protein